MSYNLIITKVVENHIFNACDYYETQQAGLSERFLSELHTVYREIATNPHHHSYISSNLDNKYRDIKLYRFPFVAVYEVTNNDIVVPVFNTYRKPMY